MVSMTFVCLMCLVRWFWLCSLPFLMCSGLNVVGRIATADFILYNAARMMEYRKTSIANSHVEQYCYEISKPYRQVWRLFCFSFHRWMIYSAKIRVHSNPIGWNFTLDSVANSSYHGPLLFNGKCWSTSASAKQSFKLIGFGLTHENRPFCWKRRVAVENDV